MKELPPKGATERQREEAINSLIRGRSNAIGRITLAASATTTTVTTTELPNLNENAEVFLAPRTANAAAALASGSMFWSISRIANELTLTITHASTSTTDRTFGVLVIGG